MSPNIDDYSDIEGGGVVNKEPVKPEDEFFHSIYIAGQSRVNHINITEEAKKIQVRGVEYNLTEANMIIIHVKEILAKLKQGPRGEITECFSYKDGDAPWFGTTKLPDGGQRQCPMNSSERAVVEFCNTCKSQILVAGIYCDATGKPILSEKKTPIFVFVRGKGMKYSNVSDYLGDMYKKDLTPIFTPVTERTTKFEKANVNNKRFVTKLTVGEASSSFGMKDVFILTSGQQIPDNNVIEILKVSQKTKEKFIEKFDWSKGVGATQAADQSQQADGVLNMGGDETPPETENPPKPDPEPDSKPFSFDDVAF
jgi:hypothetical protein